MRFPKDESSPVPLYVQHRHGRALPTLKEMIRGATDFYRYASVDITIRQVGWTLAKDNAFTPVTFCTVRLDEKGKKAFDKWAGSDEYDHDELLTILVGDGIKVGISYNSKNGSIMASMTDKSDGSPNHNSCVTSYAPTVVKAVAVMLFKYFVLLTEVAWSEFDSGPDWG